MATIIPLENWGQVKLTTVPLASKPESGVKQEESAEPQKEVQLQLVSLPKGKERTSASFVSQPRVTIPVPAIASASGTTKNDVSILLRPQASVSKATKGGETAEVELTSVRFAVPNACVGYEQTEEAGRVILQEIQQAMNEYQRGFLRSRGHGENDLLTLATLGAGQDAHSDETAIGTFDDVMLSYPSGKYKMVLSNYSVVLEDKKKAAASGALVSFPLSDIQQLYLCDVPAHFSRTGDADEEPLAQYVVLILKNPMKIRTTSYTNVVISCPAGMVLDDAHPWTCDLKTQEDINRVLGFPKAEEGVEYPLVPSMSGRVSEILIRTFKAIARVPAYGGVNKEYRTVLTQNRHSCMRCVYRGSDGLLYIVNGGLLFLHRPATKLAFSDIKKVEMDESVSGTATFQLSVYANGPKGEEKHVFSGLDKLEKDNLLEFLAKKVNVVRRGVDNDDSDDEDEEDDEEGSEGNSEGSGSDEADDDDGEDSDDDDDDDDSKRHHHRKRDRSKEKEKKHKKHKKDKKHKKHKKDKKDKKHKHSSKHDD